MLENYLCVYPSGELRWIQLERCVRFDDGYDGELKLLYSPLYEIIGCTFLETVHSVLPGIVFMIDDSGKVSGLQRLNPLASRFYAGAPYGDLIFGPAVFFALCPVPDCPDEYDIYPLSAIQEQQIAAILGKPLPHKPLSDPLSLDLKGGDLDD